MPSHIYSKEDYDKLFDAEAFLTRFYCPRYFRMSGSLHRRLFDEIVKLDVKEGGQALEFGCGPSIVNACIASHVFKDITLAEFAQPNRDILMKWLHKEELGFDWSSILKNISDLEQQSHEDIAERTRLAIKEVIPCDARNDNILLKAQRGPFDFVISTLCLEVASFNLDSYRKAMSNPCGLVKTGGTIFLTGPLCPESYYLVGGKKFHALSINKEDVVRAIESTGMEIITYLELSHDFGELTGALDCYSLVAVKPDK